MSSIRLPWPDWVIVRRIGAGGFGTVYEIVRRDESGYEEHAALKVVSIPNEQGAINSLRMDGYDDDSITARYREYAQKLNKEYDFLKELKGHSNIVNVYDNCMALHEDGLGWDIFIRMELLHPMQEILGKEKTLSEEEVIRLGKDMCEALNACHARNIIHRDIKPENIFRSDSGDWKLGDFGIARTMEHTTTATKAGTPEYEAPEVYHGERYGKEVDIYSLGLVLYWLLNNRRRPFLPVDRVPKESEVKEARNKRFGGYPLPAPLNGSPGLKQIVLKACSYNPKDRYASADNMYRDLLAVESGAYQVHSSAPAGQDGTQSSYDVLEGAHGDSGRSRNVGYENESSASVEVGPAPDEGDARQDGWDEDGGGSIGDPRLSGGGKNKIDDLKEIGGTQRSVAIDDKPTDSVKEESSGSDTSESGKKTGIFIPLIVAVILAALFLFGGKGDSSDTSTSTQTGSHDDLQNGSNEDSLDDSFDESQAQNNVYEKTEDTRFSGDEDTDVINKLQGLWCTYGSIANLYSFEGETVVFYENAHPEEGGPLSEQVYIRQESAGYSIEKLEPDEGAGSKVIMESGTEYWMLEGSPDVLECHWYDENGDLQYSGSDSLGRITDLTADDIVVEGENAEEETGK